MKIFKPHKKLLIPAVLFIASVGTIVTLSTRASAPAIDIEPELGQLSGNTEVISDASASASSAVQFKDALRIYAYQPFSPTSFWNIPIHDGVTYTDASDIRNEWTKQISGTINYLSDWNLAIWQATDGDPLVEIKAPRFNYPTWPSAGARFRVPADGVVPGPAGDGTYNVQYDGWVTIISPDGATAIDLYKAKWITPGVTLQAAYAVSYALDGEDPRVGVKASRFSYIGGTIRKWEMTSTEPAETRIQHAISMSLPRNELIAPYKWPAAGQDYGWEADYVGFVPMGTCFALPWSFDIENAGLSDDGRALAYALQRYGAFVGDASSSAVIYAEMNSPADKGAAYRVAWQALIPHLVAIDGRSATLPGGPGNPRVPLVSEGTLGQITP